VPERIAKRCTENFDEIDDGTGFDFGNVGAALPVLGNELFPKQYGLDPAGYRGFVGCGRRA